MTQRPLVRRLLKVIHPEGIPWPGSLVYNFLSASDIFQKHYELVADDFSHYCENGTILDIGTGPGWLLLKLHIRLPNLHLVGMDVSAAMVAKARDNIAHAGLLTAIEIQQGSASKILSPPDSFDAIISTASIHHWKEPVACLNEIHRVLKPNGYAVIYDLVSNTPPSVLAQAQHRFGRLKTTLLWLHSFEEPFYDDQSMQNLACESVFGSGQTGFVGVLCRLLLRKAARSGDVIARL